MKLITVQECTHDAHGEPQPDGTLFYFHSFGALGSLDVEPYGNLRLTSGVEAAHHFSTWDAAHECRESKAFWDGLQLFEAGNICVSIVDLVETTNGRKR